MISATSLNAQSTLNKGPQIQMVGLENGRMRVDSQKFLVPSLPVSARAIGNHHNASDSKRRERSIVNGTPHPPQSDNHYSHHHHHNLSHNYPSHNINGLRTSYGPHSGSNNSPHNNSNNNISNHRTSPHHPYSHLNNSPRKDAHSPMYAGEVPGLSPGGGGSYQARSSMPIPCSSPAQASSASPKGSHSHSPSSGTPAGGVYSPKLPSGPAVLPPLPAGTAELSSLAAAGRLYSGFPPPHPSVAAHLSPAFYAAAAAAAVSHSIPYPIFGAHYSPHSHSAAAASAYLDSFHSALASRGPPPPGDRQRSRSPSPPHSRAHGSYHHTQSQHQQQQSQHHHSSSQSTSVTSLHNKLIQLTTVSSDRQSYNDHHNHFRSSPNASDSFSPGALGISQGGPLGISGGIMGIGHGLTLQSSRMTNGSSPQKVLQGENLTMNKSTNLNGYNVSSKPWMEHPGLSGNESMNRKYAAEMEVRDARDARDNKNFYKESNVKHQNLERSSDNSSHLQKSSKTISFASDTYPPNNGYRVSNVPPNSYLHTNGHQHVPLSSNPGILTDSNYSKKHVSNQQITISHQNNQQTQQFLPPSPKKRTGQWNFAVPASPTSKLDLPPPPPPSTSANLSSQAPHASVHEPSKYLNSNQNQNHKPSNQHHSLSVSNGSTNKTAYLSPGQSAQHSYPSSPRQAGNGPSTPKSPSVHQVKFSFSSGNSKENINGLKNGNKSGRTDSSSSTSSNEGNVPWPVEQMPLLEAFRCGSLIKLANGDLKPVEDLRAEDFIHAAANMADALRIIHCTVLSIQGNGSTNGSSVRKVTLAIGSQLQNQQVVVPSTPEQPFFVLGRGWSSLSPKTTEKLLQLPCSTLAVGDVCITLSKNSSKIQAQANGPSQSQVPKSPSVKSKGNGSKSRIPAAISNPNNSVKTATTANLKRNQQALVCPITSNNNPLAAQESRKTVGNNNKQIGTMSLSNGQKEAYNLSANNPIIKNCMGPPLSTTISTKGSDPQVDKIMIDMLRPPSPKRRRWSAPEPETIAEHENESSIKGKNFTPPPPSCLTSRDNDEPGSDKNKADVNSNLEFRTPDAQTVKA